MPILTAMLFVLLVAVVGFAGHFVWAFIKSQDYR